MDFSEQLWYNYCLEVYEEGFEMSKTVAYIRVSSKEQNLDRQLDILHDLGIEDKYIYQDKQSGKDFDRIGYQYMKKSLEQGDTLVIKELDRLGRNQDELKQEWGYFRDNDINVRVLDLPALNINYDDENIKPLVKMINNIIFEIMSWKAQNERETTRRRQLEGIKSAHAKGVKFGRPKADVLDDFGKVYAEWKLGYIKAVEAMKLLDMKKTRFYRNVKEYEQNNVRKEKL